MYQRKFHTQIGIVALESMEQLDARKAMPETAGRAFVDGIFEALSTLYSKPGGKLLLDEIEAAMKPVIIYCASVGNKGGSAASPYPATIDNEMQRFIQLRQLPAPALIFAQKHNPEFVPPSQAAYAALFHSTIESSKMNRDIIARLIGISREDLDSIELGLKPLSPEQYHRFAILLYDFLDRGKGCSVGLRMDSTQVTREDPYYILLGHELVHVWRMVTGSRIFEGGWEEEAMTTGIPPFMGMKFSENKLRAEHGLGVRPKNSASCMTAYYKQMSATQGGEMGIKGIAPEHQLAWYKWQSENPKLAQEKIKLTKKSVISGPRTNFWNK